MAAMATLLPLYDVMCLVALATAAVLIKLGKGESRKVGRQGRSSIQIREALRLTAKVSLHFRTDCQKKGETFLNVG